MISIDLFLGVMWRMKYEIKLTTRLPSRLICEYTDMIKKSSGVIKPLALKLVKRLHEILFHTFWKIVIY